MGPQAGEGSTERGMITIVQTADNAPRAAASVANLAKSISS